MLIAAYAIKNYGIFASYPQGSCTPCKADKGQRMVIRQRLIPLALSSPIFYIFKTGEQYETPEIHRGHRNYELEELRSYECWSLLTPELLDSKLINSVCSVVNF
jgi:hypothetical protein